MAPAAALLHSGRVLPRTWSAGYWSGPLFWRVFVLNAVVFVVGVGGLALLPGGRLVSTPDLDTELVVLGLGLLLMVIMNGVLLRLGFAPLGRLIGIMATVDLLRPGQRIPERANKDMASLARAFNDMLARLERERAASSIHALSAQEEERRRIARELHDEIGQGLTVLLLELSRLSDQVPDDQRPILEQTVEIARGSLTDVRRIAQRLRPDVLDDLGLTAALAALVEEFSQFSGVPVRRRLAPIPPLSADAGVVVYRIAQESLTNVARHAGAQCVELTLGTCENAGVRLVIADDGCGFAGVEGAGIHGMRERALLVHGDLDITARNGGGSVVTLVLPRTVVPKEEAVAGGAGSRAAR